MAALTATLLLSAPAAVLAVAAAGLALGHPVAGWYAAPGAVAAAAVALAAGRAGGGGAHRRRRAGAALLLATGITAGAFALAPARLDTSPDGLGYHQLAVLELARGWNPWRSPAAPRAYFFFQAVNMEHFPKGSWIVEAVAARAAGRLEVAKGLHLVLLAAAALAAFAALRTLPGLAPGGAALVAAVVALDPVAATQAFTFYVDGQLASLFTALAALGLLAVEGGGGIPLAGAASATLLLAGAKLTGAPYALVAWAALVAAALLRRGTRRAASLAAVGGAACAVGILFTGWNPYVTNALRAGHPFHPAAGPRAIDFVASDRPPGFAGMSRFERVARSVFSAPASEPGGRPRLKIPFTIAGDEATKFVMPDVRVAGLGPFFGGAILAALAAWWLALRAPGAGAAGLAALALLGTVFVTAEGWWARFAPQLWLFPAILALPALAWPGRRVARAAAAFAIAALAADAGVVAVNNLNRNRPTQAAVRRQLEALRASGTTVDVDFDLNPALAERFRAAGVRWREVSPLPCARPVSIEGAWFGQFCPPGP